MIYTLKRKIDEHLSDNNESASYLNLDDRKSWQSIESKQCDSRKTYSDSKSPGFYRHHGSVLFSQLIYFYNISKHKFKFTFLSTSTFNAFSVLSIDSVMWWQTQQNIIFMYGFFLSFSILSIVYFACILSQYNTSTLRTEEEEKSHAQCTYKTIG